MEAAAGILTWSRFLPSLEDGRDPEKRQNSDEHKDSQQETAIMDWGKASLIL